MESISRISGMLETARDLTLEAARDVSMSRKPPRLIPAAHLRRLLDSRKDAEVLDGLRKITSMSYQHLPTLQFFSAVVKNVASPNIEIKKLVYAYLVAHAEESPDTALLSINTIQKTLSDSNPHLRALALRTMSSIRVPVISQIVALGIKRGAVDMNPFVRRAAALAIPKCLRLDPNTQPLLEEQLGILLGDKQYYVAGAAVMAFLEVCPENLDMIHPHYRSLVRKLVDMDEWGQLATLKLVLSYARQCFPLKHHTVKAPNFDKSEASKGFYDESDSEPEGANTATSQLRHFDPDLELFLRSAQSLLQSRNSAVIIAVSRCYLYLADSTYQDLTVGPLISLLRGPPEVQALALYNIVQFCLVRPSTFVPYATHFLLRGDDSLSVQELKFEALTLLFAHVSAHIRSLILGELTYYSHSHSPHLVEISVQALGRCAESAPTPELSTRCLHVLLAQLGSADVNLVAASLEVVRRLIQRDPAGHSKTIIRLAKNLDSLTAPTARSSIVWLVGEFAATDANSDIAADVLRILVRGFADEALQVKHQIILLAAKLYLQHLNKSKPAASQDRSEAGVTESTTPPFASNSNGYEPFDGNEDQQSEESTILSQLWQHVLLLARYDTSYDLRDRARLYRALLAIPQSTDLASLLLLAPKPLAQAPSPSESRKSYVIGTASLVIGNDAGVGGLRGVDNLPDWVKEGQQPSSQLRDEGAPAYGETKELTAGERLDQVAKQAAPLARTNGTTEKNLDDWLAEEDSPGEAEESSEEEYETETGSEEESSEEESGEEETDDDDHAETGRLMSA